MQTLKIWIAIFKMVKWREHVEQRCISEIQNQNISIEISMIMVTSVIII